MHKNERFSFFVSLKRFFATRRTVDTKEEEAEDLFDEEEDLAEEEEDEEEDDAGIPFAVSLCFRSRFAFFQV